MKFQSDLCIAGKEYSFNDYYIYFYIWWRLRCSFLNRIFCVLFNPMAELAIEKVFAELKELDARTTPATESTYLMNLIRDVDSDIHVGDHIRLNQGTTNAVDGIILSRALTTWNIAFYNKTTRTYQEATITTLQQPGTQIRKVNYGRHDIDTVALAAKDLAGQNPKDDGTGIWQGITFAIWAKSLEYADPRSIEDSDTTKVVITKD